MSVYYNGMHSITFWDASDISEGIGTDPYPIHSWDDLHLIPSSRPSIMIPEPNVQMISIPGTNKRYDITDYFREHLPVFNEYTGEIERHYTHGKVTGEWEFIIDYTKYDNWSEAYRLLLSTLHGKRMMITLNDDPTKIYNGMIVMTAFNPGTNYTTVTIQYDLDKGYYDVSDPYHPIPPSTRFPSNPPIYMRIRFIGMNGRVLSTEYYLYGDYPSIPAPPSVSGYKFIGWNPSVEVVSHGQDYVAQYSSNTSDPTTKVRYRFLQRDGTTVISSGKVYSGSTPPIPDSSKIPTIEGYEFSGWNPTVGAISQNTDYVAQYAQLYLIRFLEVDETTVIISGYYASGATVTPPTPPTVSGYIFDHWEPTVTTVSKNQDYVAKYVIDGTIDDSKNLIEGTYVDYVNDEVTRIADYAFYYYSFADSPLGNRLKTASFANCNYIGAYAFAYCNQLIRIRLLNSSVVELANTNAFYGCNKLVRIEVPSNLVESYKSDSKWQSFSSKIYAAST